MAAQRKEEEKGGLHLRNLTNPTPQGGEEKNQEKENLFNENQQSTNTVVLVMVEND